LQYELEVLNGDTELSEYFKMGMDDLNSFKCFAEEASLQTG
jgi:hypothetical protein